MSKVKYTVKKKLEVINYVLEGHSSNFLLPISLISE